MGRSHKGRIKESNGAAKYETQEQQPELLPILNIPPVNNMALKRSRIRFRPQQRSRLCIMV